MAFWRAIQVVDGFWHVELRGRRELWIPQSAGNMHRRLLAFAQMLYPGPRKVDTTLEWRQGFYV